MPTMPPPPPSPTPFGLYGQSLLDVTYCALDGQAHELDLYLPETGGPWPVLVYIHGGGWTEGDKSEAQGLGEWMTGQGYAVAAVNYRLYPYGRFPGIIQDIKCAIRFLRAHAGDYNLDPERIAALGASAGGHLAALIGTSDQSAGWDVGEFTGYSSRVQAVINTVGPTDLTARLDRGDLETVVVMAFGRANLEAASPITHVSADDPPFLLLYGEKDPIVSPSHGQAFYERLVGAGVPAQLVIVANGGHNLQSLDGSETIPTQDDINTLMLDFLKKYLKE